MMKIYLDNCCFNRPFDDQIHYRIRVEAEAKLYIQDLLRQGVLELVWSYMLDYENDANPFTERRKAVAAWRNVACQDIDESNKVIDWAQEYSQRGIKAGDSLHLACAVVAGCEFFLTTDEEVLQKTRDCKDIRVVDPATFIREIDK